MKVNRGLGEKGVKQMFKKMVRILTLDEDVIAKTEKMMKLILRYDLKVRKASEARRVYKLWHGVLCNINQAFFGEWVDVDEKWARDILREIYFLVRAVDQSPGTRFIRIKC